MRSIISRRSLFVGILVSFLSILSVFYNNFGSVNLNSLMDLEVNSSSEDMVVPGRLLVQPKPGVSEEQLDKILFAHGGKKIGKIKQVNIHIVELPPQVSEKAVEALLAHHPQLNFAERDHYIKPSLIPNDPYFPNGWHLAKMNAPLAWDTSIGTGVTIAILDSGVNMNHADLVANLVPGYNFYDNNTNTADVYGHGTITAGAAGAVGNNGVGVTSISWNSKIMPIRVTGTDGYATWSGLTNGLTYAADHGARVASMSFQNPSMSSSVISAASYLRSKGGLALGAAGNTGALDSTANTPEIIIVAATDGNDAKASWSTYGTSVDITAPGVGIYTTHSGGGYSSGSGTSLSTPVVAGVVALMMSANPNLQPKQIESILFSTSVDLGTSGWDQYYGYGRVDAAAAVLQAKNTLASDTTNPSVAFTSPTSGAKINGIVSIAINATDNIAVNRVELYIGSTLLASDSQAPYEFSFDSTMKPDGNITLTAKAFDSAGNSSSSSVSVTIDNVVDTVAPAITISNPVGGSVVKGNVTVSALASDNEGVASMSLYIDGALKASSASGSVSFVWNTRKATVGAHTIRVDAKDLSGNIASKSIQVTK